MLLGIRAITVGYDNGRDRRVSVEFLELGIINVQTWDESCYSGMSGHWLIFQSQS